MNTKMMTAKQLLVFELEFNNLWGLLFKIRILCRVVLSVSLKSVNCYSDNGLPNVFRRVKMLRCLGCVLPKLATLSGFVIDLYLRVSLGSVLSTLYLIGFAFERLF